jgi:hypothetical protein
VAVNCWVVPLAITTLAGVTAIETKVALVTVKVAVFDTAPKVAVMVVLPAAMALAIPLLPAALEIVAFAVADEDQLTRLVMFCVLESE